MKGALAISTAIVTPVVVFLSKWHLPESFSVGAGIFDVVGDLPDVEKAVEGTSGFGPMLVTLVVIVLYEGRLSENSWGRAARLPGPRSGRSPQASSAASC